MVFSFLGLDWEKHLELEPKPFLTFFICLIWGNGKNLTFLLSDAEEENIESELGCGSDPDSPSAESAGVDPDSPSAKTAGVALILP